MNETGFRQFLRRSGKKPHVVDELIREVALFEGYVANKSQIDLTAVGSHELQEYAQTLTCGQAKKQLRALSLYFRFAGSDELAERASEMREQEIARTRHAFRLRDFRGVNLVEVAKLEAIGIVTVEHLLIAGKTPHSRRLLSMQSGVPLPVVLELVKLADLSRLGAIKAVRARLYYEAGLDTPDKFIGWEPQALRQMLLEFVDRTGFDGIAPLPKELQNAIAAAQHLSKAVQY